MPATTEISAKSSTPVRGRNDASKPLNLSSGAASSKPSSTPSASGSTSNRPSRPPSSSSTTSSKSSTAGPASRKANLSRTPSRGSESGFKVTKLSSTTVTLPTTWAPRPPAPEPPKGPAAPEQAPTHTSDPLQVAAQVYPWMHMSSTLDACFKGAEAAATNELETRTKEIEAEESEIADQRDRLEADSAIDFFDELGSDGFATEAPIVMQLFRSHGESCTRIENLALKLANRTSRDPADEDPLKAYNDMLSVLEDLQNEALKLQNHILKLTKGVSTSTAAAQGAMDGDTANPHEEESSARSQVSGLFVACLPVLRARIANLSLAQDLIDSALENVSLTLRMESMGIL